MVVVPCVATHAIQLAGLLAVVFGLGRTWWQWSDSPTRKRLGAWMRKLRRRDATTHAASGTASGSFGFSGSAQRLPGRPTEGDSLDAVLTYVEKLVSNADERRKRDTKDTRDLLSQVEQRSESRDADLSSRVDAVAAAQHQTAKTLSLDGLLVALLGVAASSVGLLLSWPAWCA